MSIDGRDIDDGDRHGASQLLARAAAALSRADRGLAQTIDDFFLADDARLDDRTRATLAATLAAMVAAVEGDLRARGARADRRGGARGDAGRDAGARSADRGRAAARSPS